MSGFWGVLPLTLKELDYSVAMTESLKYYNNSFDALFDFIRGRGVTVFDYDPFEVGAAPYEQFDAVTLMAVLEHLSGMRVVAEDFYNYTPGSSPNLKMLMRRPVQFMAFLMLKEAREGLAVLCERDGGQA